MSLDQGLIVTMSVIVIIMFATIETLEPFFHSTLLHSFSTPDIFGLVFISAAMALHTYLVVVNAFL